MELIKNNFEIIVSENKLDYKQSIDIKGLHNYLYIKQSPKLKISNLNNENFIIIIYGEILNYQLREIVALSEKSHIENEIASFQGSFVLFIYDKSQGNLKVFSDRINSKTIFIYKGEHYAAYSNSIFNFKSKKLSLNEGDNRKIFQLFFFHKKRSVLHRGVLPYIYKFHL